MDDVEFSDEFCAFLKAAVPAMNAAELLLLLHRRFCEKLTPDEAVARLGPGVTHAEAGRYLELFEAHGLVAREGERYAYRTDSAYAPCVETLAQAYSQRPVTLIRVIYALRDSKIQSFADAFKLRKP